MRKEGRAFFDVDRSKKMKAAQDAQKNAQSQTDTSNNNSQQVPEKMPSVCARAMQGM